MAAAAEQPLEQRMEAFLHSLFRPSLVKSFYNTSIRAVIHHSANESENETIEIENVYPFFTIYDIKLLIFKMKNFDPNYMPSRVFMSYIKGKGRMGRYVPIDYRLFIGENIFSTKNPFDMSTIDSRFVDSAGERRILKIEDRKRVLVEDLIKNEDPIHIFTYNDMLRTVPGEQPVSEKVWNGTLYPFFPSLSATHDGSEYIDTFRRYVAVLDLKIGECDRFEDFLRRGYPLQMPTFSGLRFLQLRWSKMHSIQGVDSIFYNVDVNQRMPYMRLMSSDGRSISKFHLLENGDPDIQDVRTLKRWASETNPTPNRDFVMAKILVKEFSSNQPPLYSTLRLLDDGSADLNMAPPSGIRKLNPETDLDTFATSVSEAISNLTYLNSLPDIGNATFLFGILYEDKSFVINATKLRERMRFFRTFFQEITPISGERPLITFRYKAVSNFTKEGRVFTFLTQFMSRKKVKGDLQSDELMTALSDEFQIDSSEAEKYITDWYRQRGQVEGDDDTFILEEHPGIDIAVFAQHPFYPIHIYNINSVKNLQRILTLLSILFTIDYGDLGASASVKGGVTVGGAQVGVPGAIPPPPPVLEDEDEEEEEENLPPPVESPEEEEEEVPPPVESPEEEEEEVPPPVESPEEEEEEVPPPVESPEEEEEAAEEAAEEPSYLEDLAFEEEEEAAPPAAAAVTPILPKKISLFDLQRAKVKQGQKPTVQEVDEEVEKDKTKASYFLNKLKEADKELFDYSKGKKIKGYAEKCQATETIQPAVLSQGRYDFMISEYANDNVVFKLYPLESGATTAPKKPLFSEEPELITVLRIGSKPDRHNYYLCSRYFCTYDDMVVLIKDFQGTRLRREKRYPDGSVRKTKPANTCPFCEGKLIIHHSAPGMNETVIERVSKKKGKIPSHHTYVGFMSKTTHPSGYYLPCCFLKDHSIKITDPKYEKYRGLPPVPERRGEESAAAAAAAAADSDESEEEVDSDDEYASEDGNKCHKKTKRSVAVFDCILTLSRVTKKQIIDSLKLPLEFQETYREKVEDGKRVEALDEGPQIGLVPEPLNVFFQQQEQDFIRGVGMMKYKLKDNAKGFMRVGVENRKQFRSESFLAAIAPYLTLNNASQVKRLFLDKISPRIFMELNYGNLVIEFYKPTTTRRTDEAREALRLWCSRNLGVDLSSENEESMYRFYNSYINFRAFLLNGATTKEYRQFALLLAQSNLLRGADRPGITLIVLDILSDGSVKIRCPPYGYNYDLMELNDVGFVMHHYSGIWEPLFYVDTEDTGTKGVEPSTLLFQKGLERNWPEIVKQRVLEFKSQCNAIGRAAYTSQSKISSLNIPTTSELKKLKRNPALSFYGVIRDSYNHIGAFIFSEKDSDALFAVPAVDDGALQIEGALIMDWDDFQPAPANTYFTFYEKHILPQFKRYPDLKPKRMVQSRGKQQIVAVQLTNNLYMPAAPPESEEVAADIPWVVMDEMEWKINADIVYDMRKIGSSDLTVLSLKNFQEIYEHLRITFANWLNSAEGSAAVRKPMETILFRRDLPLFEKRKRLSILLSSTVLSWLTDAGYQTPSTPILLRVDCRIQSMDACSGRCSWVASDKTCRIHTPANMQVGEATVSASKVLLERLVEEILRFAEKRRQLFVNDIRRLSVLTGPLVFRNQTIIPENTSSWYELLRQDWSRKEMEVPLFLEEKSRAPQPAAAVSPAAADVNTISEQLFDFFRADSKAEGLIYLYLDLQRILAFLEVDPAALPLDPAAQSFTRDQIHNLAFLSKKVVIHIDELQLPITLMGNKPFMKGVPPVVVIIITKKGPALLVRQPNEAIFLKEDLPGVLEDAFSTFPIAVKMKAAAAAAPGQARAGAGGP
jgi:hypothetical protein